MTHRERILAAIRGEIPDRLPWVPRWGGIPHIALPQQRQRGAVPWFCG